MWLCFVVSFFNRATAHTHEPIFAHNSSKDAVWCKKDPFRDEKCVFVKFGGVLPQNTPKMVRNGQLLAKLWNNLENVRDNGNMSISHEYETRVALLDSVNKTCVKCFLVEKSRWRHFRLEIKPRYLGNHASQIQSYYGTQSGGHGSSVRIRREKSPGGKIPMTSNPACN